MSKNAQSKRKYAKWRSLLTKWGKGGTRRNKIHLLRTHPKSRKELAKAEGLTNQEL